MYVRKGARVSVVGHVYSGLILMNNRAKMEFYFFLNCF